MCKLNDKYIIILGKCIVLLNLNYIECNQNILTNFSQLNQQVGLFLIKMIKLVVFQEIF